MMLFCKYETMIRIQLTLLIYLISVYMNILSINLKKEQR